MHGKNVIIEETLDWRPYDYFTIAITLPVPGAPKIVMTRALLDGPEGTTHLEMRVAKPKSKDKAFVDGATARYADNVNKAIPGLRSLAEGAQPVGVEEEPTRRTPTGRFLSEPVKAASAGLSAAPVEAAQVGASASTPTSAPRRRRGRRRSAGGWLWRQTCVAAALRQSCA